MKKKSTLSIVICTKNEERNIKDCILSASFADEVLIIDSGSSDGTVEIARKSGARVIETDWPGYGPQQNRAIDASSGEWIFSIDADERITDELKEEILKTINQGDFKVYDVPRRSFFITKFMNYSGWWPDRTRRLFKRNFARFTTHEIHANLSSTEPLGHLKSHMIHYSYQNYDEILEKMNRYSSGAARDRMKQGEKGGLSKAILHGLWTFIRTYIIRLGFLDGKQGFILAVSHAEGCYYRYLKIWLLQQEANKPL